GAAAKQRDLQQRPQHGRDQQRDEHGDDYKSKRADPDRAAFGSDGACGAARRRVAASEADSSSACPGVASASCCALPRAGIATRGSAEGRHASAPAPAGRSRAVERAWCRGETSLASIGPTLAGDEGAASAIGARQSDNTEHAVGRDSAEYAIRGAWQYEARTRALASARVNIGETDVSLRRDNAQNGVTHAGRRCQVCSATDAGCSNSFGRDRSDYVITGAAQYQPRTGALASGRVTGDINVSLDRDSARNALIRDGRRCEADDAADFSASFGHDHAW